MPAEGFEGFEGGQTAVLNALKNRWLGRVAAELPWKGLRKGLKHCLGHVAARVALERPDRWKGLKRLTAGKQSFNALLGKACGKV